MRILYKTFIWIACLHLTFILSGQETFECNGKLLISGTNGTNTSIFQPIFIPFGKPFLSIVAKYEGNFDALGFNPKDNYIYAVEQNTNNIVRLSFPNDFQRIGRAPGSDSLMVNAGDCTAEGLYFCYDYGLHQMLVFDVVDNFSLLRKIDLFWDPTSPNKGAFATRIFDFAFDPNDPKTAYSYQGSFKHESLLPEATQGYMLKINLNLDDPNLGMVTPLGKTNFRDVSHLAGMVFDPKSNLSGFGTSLYGLNPTQSTLYNVNASAGQVTPVLSNSPGFSLSDACSCPFSLEFTNAVPFEGMFCNNDKKNFTIAIDNNSYLPLTDVTLKDTFPEGTVINAISGKYKGTIEAGTGKGSNILSITGLLIPAKEKMEITIELLSISAKDGPAYNRAYLLNLPARFPDVVASDDPNSSTFADRSNFFFATRPLSKVSWQVISPTDCLEPKDGKLIVSSPEFSPGQGFEVGLRNKVGWAEKFITIYVNEDNTFTIDSLLPGDYQLFRFRSLDENCSRSLKDTTILIEAKNIPFDLKVGSNSPICEGETILLTSTSFPNTTIYWTGPAIFGSEENNPVIENASASQSGRYEVVANYGYCEQKETIVVDVKETLTTTIEGDSVYCTRDKINLTVASNQDEVQHLWSGPDGVIQPTGNLLQLTADQRQSGQYKVISTNGACLDTADIDLMIWPAPTLLLDSVLVTDYCDPLYFQPQLEVPSTVSYEWNPAEGLSCSNCDKPQVIPILQPQYRLKVVNEFGCSDSAKVQLQLKKDRIAFAPNIFSRNASFINTRFAVQPACAVLAIHSMEIYDRLGNPVFSSKALDNAQAVSEWDGLINGKAANPGVYVWIAKVELVDGSTTYLTGDVTVL